MNLTAKICYGSNGKACIGRATGSDPRWGVALEWLGTRRETSRSGRTGHVSATVIEPGLYREQDSDGTKRDVVLLLTNGELVRIGVRAETALEIARAMDEGHTVNEIEPQSHDGKWSIRLGSSDGPIAWRHKVIEQSSSQKELGVVSAGTANELRVPRDRRAEAVMKRDEIEKVIRDVKECVAAVEPMIEGFKDGGTCNMDSPTLVLDRKCAALERALEAAGISNFWSKWSGLVLLVGNFGGQAARRTKGAMLVAEELEKRGYTTSVHFQMD